MTEDEAKAHREGWDAAVKAVETKCLPKMTCHPQLTLNNIRALKYEEPKP